MAARPQPIASIQPTRTPTSRLASGFSAEARSARPVFVNWKNAHEQRRRARARRDRADVLLRDRDAADLQVSFGNGLGKARTSADQIKPAAPLKMRTRPIVTITTVSIGRALDRPDHDALDAEAEREGEEQRRHERGPVRPAVVRGQRPGDVGREHRHLALGEVDHPGRAVDQDERERERGVDRPGAEPGDDLLEERPPQSQ